MTNAHVGIGLMALALLTFTVSDALTKWLGASYPPGQVICVRAVFAMLPIAAMVRLGGGLRSLGVQNVRGQIQRALVFAATSSAIAMSVILLPIADAAALLYASPLFVTALAAPMLGEKVGGQRWGAVVVGFVGVLIMLRPTAGVIQLVALVPLLAALLSAFRDILGRLLSRTESNTSMMFWSNLALIALSGLTAVLGWAPIGAFDLLLMAVAGCLVGVAQYMVLQAYRVAEAAVVAPIKYTGIVWAALAGYVVWGTLPDAFILAGSALVIGAGLSILEIERRRAALAA